MSAPGYSIGPADGGELSRLAAIERRAASRFADVGLGVLTEGPVTELSVFEAAHREGRLWVARHEGSQQAVGFALARPLGESVHLQEMDVLPEHGRQGLGGRLVEAVFGHARAIGAPWVSLTTFRDVPWNAPFYARLGFEEWPPDALTPAMRALVAGEIEAGFMPDLRLVMRRFTGAAAPGR